MTISATVVADSISPQGHRLRSVQVTAHRFILAEINTHRMLSRSYRSSRAVPVKRLLEEVRENPAMPVHWGANEPGMQARAELSTENDGFDLYLGTDRETTEVSITGWDGRDVFIDSSPRQRAEVAWRMGARTAADLAEGLAKGGLHKQIANRVLEPFLWVHGIITATEWDNFFGLRLHEDAQPEFRALADAVWAAFKASEPTQLDPGGWHLPYVDEDDKARLLDISRTHHDLSLLDLARKTSTARCARSSYNSFDTGKRSTLEEDLVTYAKLNIPGTEFYDPTRPIHASPAEHQGTPDKMVPTHLSGRIGGGGPYVWAKPGEHGNFVGFRQHRKMLPGEAVAPLPEDYR